MSDELETSRNSRDPAPLLKTDPKIRRFHMTSHHLKLCMPHSKRCKKLAISDPPLLLRSTLPSWWHNQGALRLLQLTCQGCRREVLGSAEKGGQNSTNQHLPASPENMEKHHFCAGEGKFPEKLGIFLFQVSESEKGEGGWDFLRGLFSLKN